MLSTNYASLLNVTKALWKNNAYLDDVSNSHDVVAFYMIMMNHKVSNTMAEYGNGIYRSAEKGQTDDVPSGLSSEVKQFVKIWKCSAGRYSTFSERKGHDLIATGLDSYLHITSPIRRLVDVLNMVIFKRNLGFAVTESALEFYNRCDYEICAQGSKRLFVASYVCRYPLRPSRETLRIHSR